MSSHTLWVVAIVLGTAAFGAYGAYKTRQAWDIRSAIVDAGSATAGSLRPGQGAVELHGTAEAAEYSFRSPMTDQECIAYRLVKKKKVRKRRRDHGDDDGTRVRYEWETYEEEEGGAPFYLNDGTGRAVIDGATADLDMEQSYEVSSEDVTKGLGERVFSTIKGLAGAESTEDGPEIPDHLVKELQQASNERRFTEWVVHDGEEVYVYGEAVRSEKTPTGQGLDSELSAASGSFFDGPVGILKSMIGIGAEAATNPRTRYKPRAVKRLSAADGSGGMEAATDVETEELSEQAEQLQNQPQPQSRSQAQEMMGQMTEMFEQGREAIADQMPATPTLDEAGVVVSWGKQAPKFIVSDQGKSAVVRDYTKTVINYVLLTTVAAAIGIAAILIGFGLWTPGFV